MIEKKKMNINVRMSVKKKNQHARSGGTNISGRVSYFDGSPRLSTESIFTARRGFIRDIHEYRVLRWSIAFLFLCQLITFNK
jgi:hypothetical protein